MRKNKIIMELKKIAEKLEAIEPVVRKHFVAEYGFAIGSVISMLFMGFLAFLFITKMVPIIEASIVTTGITNEFVVTLLGIAVWVLPSAAIVYILVKVVKKIR